MIRSVQPQTNNTSDNANISNDTKLSSLDKIIISISCGIFMGLIALFLWNYFEVRYHVARQHRLILQNNTIGSFPQHSPYDAESTTSNNDDVIGHFAITSAVTTSSSSSKEIGKNMHQQLNDDVPKETPEFDKTTGECASPETLSSDFKFVDVGSPDFNETSLHNNIQSTVNEALDVDESDDDCFESFDTYMSYAKDSESLPNDANHSPIEASIPTGSYNVNTSNDDALSIPSGTTAFDIVSVGDISLEHSMASSIMK